MNKYVRGSNSDQKQRFWKEIDAGYLGMLREEIDKKL